MRIEPGKAPRSPAWCQTKANFPFKTFNWILFGNFRQTQYSELSRMLTILFFFSSRGAEKMWWCFHHIHSTALPSGGLAVKNPPADARDTRCGLDPWAGKMPRRRRGQPTPVILPGRSCGQRAWQSTGVQRVGHDRAPNTQLCFGNARASVLPLRGFKGWWLLPGHFPSD